MSLAEWQIELDDSTQQLSSGLCYIIATTTMCLIMPSPTFKRRTYVNSGPTCGVTLGFAKPNHRSHATCRIKLYVVLRQGLLGAVQAVLLLQQVQPGLLIVSRIVVTGHIVCLAHSDSYSLLSCPVNRSCLHLLLPRSPLLLHSECFASCPCLLCISQQQGTDLVQ